LKIWSKPALRIPPMDRIRRIVRATVALAVFQGLLGIMLYLTNSTSLPDLVVNAVGFLHLGAALAIVTQAASTATAYDMWEEKEERK
jgi:heme A synthase